MKKRDLQQFIGYKKGVLTVEQILTKKPNNKDVDVLCRCSRCGETVVTRLDRIVTLVNYAKNCCNKCREDYHVQELKKKFVGKSNGVLTCIDIILDNKYHTHLKYKAVCKCSRCGAITEVRVERLNSNKYSPKSCTNCYFDLLGQSTHERYFRKSGFTNEESYRDKQKTDATISKFKSGARLRGFTWDLSDAEAIDIIHKPCYYCGDTPSWGIDRVDSKQGYINDNVVSCCGMCNVMKNKFSQESFLQKIHRIYNNLHMESSTTISKESTLQANGSGNGGYPEKDSDIV